MGSVLAIVRHTFQQQIRNRLYLVVLLFAALIAGASLLLGALAADAEITVIMDLGLAAIELFGVLIALFGAVTLVLEEMESRTIYLVLTRPIPRWVYVTGRFLGLLAAVTASMAVMGLFHLGVLLLKGWEPTPFFFLSFPFMFLKVGVMTALALFFSLFSTSSVSSVVFSLFFWFLGHFGTELEFLADKARNVAAGAGMKAFLFLMPRFDLMNYRDLFEAPGVDGKALLARAAVYALLYTGACLSLSLTLFSRKEF